MSTTIQIGDQPVTLGDFSGFKFLEAMALVGEIMEAVPLADEEIARYTQQWLAQNGSERVLDRAAARYLFGQDPDGKRALEAISEEDWSASEQKLRLSKAPDGTASFLRAFPAVYKHARKQTENLICLIATPNSKLEKADAEGHGGDDLYKPGGAVHEMRGLVLHTAKLADQAKLVLGSMRQLAEELEEADLGAQMGEFRAAVKALNGAINPAANSDESERESDAPSDGSEATEHSEPESEPSSSMPSSPAIPA